MFETDFLLGNDVAIASLTITFFMVMFYAIGRIIQIRFKFTKSYKTLAIPLGYVSYQFISFILYSTFLVFSTDSDALY